MAKENKNKKELTEINFVFKAKDRRGKEISGEIRAVSEAVARVALRTKKYHDIQVKKQRFSNRGKVKSADVAVFTRQLATMMKSGVPLLQTFDIVGNGHSNPAVTKLLYEIKTDIEQGSSLTSAFAKFPEYFDDLYCSLLEAGEKAGILDMILDRLAEYQEKMQAIKSKIKSAMVYPIAVMGVSLIVTSILMIFVIPSFKEVFTSFGAELPGPTLFVMNLSDFFVANYMYIFGILFSALFLFSKALKTSKAVRDGFDRFLLKLPVFGLILQKSSIARWCRTLSTMFAAGVPLVEALDSVAGAAGNVVYYNATKNIQKDVATGQSLTVSMQEQNVFPNMVIQMAQIGEEAGSLDSMLNRSAEFYEGEVNDAVAAMSSLIEPFIIVFLGVVIGGLVVAMYLPIFKMASAV